MTKHFVQFLSPGTFVAEESTLPIRKWEVKKAVEMARTIKERHGAIPYGFRFITRSRGPNDLDSRITKTSGTYYLGGEVLTLQQIKDRHDPKDAILISNMECNRWRRVVVNNNSWQWTQPLLKGDRVLKVDLTPNP